MFTGNNSTPLLYTPDYEYENRLNALYALIEKKIDFFSLPQAEIKKLIAANSTIENACILGFETEDLSVNTPEEIYNFSIAVEDNYAKELNHLKTWYKSNSSTPFQKTKELLGLVDALKPFSEQEISTDNYAAIKSIFKNLQNSSVGHFTKSWLLRVALQLLQPYKAYSSSFPALVHSVYLSSNNKSFNGLLSINLETIINKAEYTELLEPYTELSPEEFATTDFTPILNLGYEVMEQSLRRVDDALKKLYREKIDYSKKDARIRNLINFLYNSAVEHLEPIMQGLNERQLQIIKYLFAKRYLGTKELSLSFRCDRKTIQRDFSKLLSSEIVRSTGNGSALKYSINLKNNSYDMLEIHSTAVRRREDYQESLFGEEIWETVKKA